MMIQALSFGAGLLFATGLGISGMTDANKVIAFLDVLGKWDPSLAFVMVGAIGVHMTLYRFILKRPSPWLKPQFELPTRADIDGRLVFGAIFFGLGWGLGGFCPGPAFVSAAGLGKEALIFTGAMVVGMWLARLTVGRPAAIEEA